MKNKRFSNRNWLLRRYLVASYPMFALAMFVGVTIWPTWGGVILGGTIAILVIVPLRVIEANRQCEMPTETPTDVIETVEESNEEK